MSYRLLSHVSNGAPRGGVLVNDMVYDLPKPWTSILAVLEDWPKAKAVFAKFAPKGKGTPLKKAKLVAPILYPGNIYCAGANYKDHVAEMDRAQGREPGPTMKGSRREAVALRQDLAQLGGGPRREGEAAGLLQVGRLGDRTRRRDRQARQGRERRQGARLRGVLHHRERPTGALCDAPRAQSADLAVPFRLGEPEVLRRCVPARTVDRAGERDQGPAQARPQALDQRRADARLEHRPDDLRHGGADRDALDPRHTESGRRRPHWHAGRRRHGSQALLEARRAPQAVDRGHRRAEPQHHLNGVRSRFLDDEQSILGSAS